MAGVKHTTSADGSFSPAGAAAWQEEHTLSDVASQTDLNALSNALSVLSATNSTEHAGLSNRITSVAGLVGGGGSVTSAEAQAISAAAQSAINTVSAAVDVVSNSLSVETAARIAAVNTVSNSLSVEIADRISAVNVVSNALSAEIAGRNSAVNAVSNALSVLSNANSASHVSIDGRVTSVANAVSVLSQALSVLSNTNSAAHVSIDGRVTSVANAVSVVSNALSVLSQTNSVDHAALSNRITSVAGLGAGSVTSAEVNAVSVAAQSAINTVSNALSVLSNTNSVDHAALSNRITSVAGLAGGGSVTSAEVNAVSVAAQSAVNTQSARIDTVSNAVSVLSNALSVLSNANSAAHVSIDGRVTSVANAVSIVSNALSVLSQTNSVDHAALSNRITSVAGLAGGGSVTSNEVSIADAALSARIDTLSVAVGNASNQLSQVSQYASVVSVYANQASNYASVASNAASVAVQAASVASAAAAAIGAPQIRKVVDVQSTAGSALVDISGLVITAAAGDNWEINGLILLSTSAATVGLRMGWSVPPLSTPRYGFFTRQSVGQSAGVAGGGGLLQVSGQSINMSITGTPGLGVPFGVRVEGIMNVASAGTIRLMYAGIASTAASPIHIMPGSYLKAVKI
jgi:hypothetical protein